MPAIIPAAGKHGLMEALMTLASLDPSTTVRLYANPITLGDATDLPDFVETTFTGYAPIELPAAVDQGIDSKGRDNWLYAPIQFTSTGPGGLPAVAYGYWIQWINPLTSTARLFWAEAFGSPWTWTATGQTLKFILSLGASQGI